MGGGRVWRAEHGRTGQMVRRREQSRAGLKPQKKGRGLGKRAFGAHGGFPNCPPPSKKGAAAAGRGTERTPSRTTERTPDRMAWRPEERKAAPERTPRRTPSRMDWRPEVRKAAPKGHPAGHPKGHPAAGSMVLAYVLIVCGVLPKGHPTAWLGGPRNVRPRPKGHPKGHPAAGSMVLACVLIVGGVLWPLIYD